MAEGEQIARVLELLPHGAFRLELESRAQVIGHPAGASVANFSRLRANDRVMVVLASHDKTRGRITRLLPEGAGV